MEIPKEAIRKCLWEGQILVQATLAPKYTKSGVSPPPFFFEVPRVSYLQLFVGRLFDHFRDDLPTDASERNAWIGFGGRPIKWLLPIGVLFDTLNPVGEVPWSLEFYVGDFPESEIPRYAGEDEIQSNFFFALKESSHVRFGTSESIMTMPQSDRVTMWNSLKDGKFDGFAQVVHSLTAHLAETARRYPLKVFTPDGQLRSKVVTKSQYLNSTLEQVLSSMFPELFGGGLPKKEDIPSAVLKPSCRITCHGIALPQQATMNWITDTFVHPDGFVYISLSSLQNRLTFSGW